MGSTDLTAEASGAEPDEAGAALAAARAGDEAAFARLAEHHRRELHLHCYRMLGSLEDAEDQVQETFLRAWRKRESFEGRASFRAWLYRIATNACLDAIERRSRRPAEEATRDCGEPPASRTEGEFEAPWLQPYPDRLLERLASPDAGPDSELIAKETIELAFVVAVQQLPARQRAVLIMRGVLGWPASETARSLETSVASVNSALQRARATLRQHLAGERVDWGGGLEPSREERDLVDRYVEATERADADAFLELLHEDARFAMPPQPELHVGAGEIVDAWKRGGFESPELGDFRCLVTRANMQPAVACYLRKPGGSEYLPLAIDVLEIDAGRVRTIIAFPSDVFPAFELPPKL